MSVIFWHVNDSWLIGRPLEDVVGQQSTIWLSSHSLWVGSSIRYPNHLISWNCKCNGQTYCASLHVSGIWKARASIFKDIQNALYFNSIQSFTLKIPKISDTTVASHIRNYYFNQAISDWEINPNVCTFLTRPRPPACMFMWSINTLLRFLLLNGKMSGNQNTSLISTWVDGRTKS